MLQSTTYFVLTYVYVTATEYGGAQRWCNKYYPTHTRGGRAHRCLSPSVSFAREAISAATCAHPPIASCGSVKIFSFQPKEEDVLP